MTQFLIRKETEGKQGGRSFIISLRGKLVCSVFDDEDDDELFLWYGYRRKAFSHTSSRNHYRSHHRESPTRREQDLNLRRT